MRIASATSSPRAMASSSGGRRGLDRAGRAAGRAGDAARVHEGHRVLDVQVLVHDLDALLRDVGDAEAPLDDVALADAVEFALRVLEDGRVRVRARALEEADEGVGRGRRLHDVERRLV